MEIMGTKGRRALKFEVKALVVSNGRVTEGKGVYYNIN